MGDKKRGSNTIISTSFAMKFRPNGKIDIDVMLFCTMIQLKDPHYPTLENGFA